MLTKSFFCQLCLIFPDHCPASFLSSLQGRSAAAVARHTKDYEVDEYKSHAKERGKALRFVLCRTESKGSPRNR